VRDERRRFQLRGKYRAPGLLMAAFAAGLLTPVFYMTMPTFAPNARHEIARLAAPDKMEDAVLIEAQASLLSHRASYEVHIGKHAAPNEVTPPVLTTTNAAGLNLQWLSPHLLEVSYRYAQIDQFTDHWRPCPECRDMVEIRLLPSAASYSYMLANSHNRISTISFPAENIAPPRDPGGWRPRG
jgi:hypothetical protein